jgi:hypothetical protein
VFPAHENGAEPAATAQRLDGVRFEFEVASSAWLTRDRWAKKMNAVAKKQSPWLSLALAAGIVCLVFIALKDIRWFRGEAFAPQSKAEEQRSPLAWQSGIWKEGFVAGERYVQSGEKPLAVAAINQKSFAKYPTDLAADILWATGFESGQMHATHKQ